MVVKRKRRAKKVSYSEYMAKERYRISVPGKNAAKKKSVEKLRELVREISRSKLGKKRRV